MGWNKVNIRPLLFECKMVSHSDDTQNITKINIGNIINMIDADNLHTHHLASSSADLIMYLIFYPRK